jgi:hypothetical protein
VADSAGGFDGGDFKLRIAAEVRCDGSECVGDGMELRLASAADGYD